MTSSNKIVKRDRMQCHFRQGRWKYRCCTKELRRMWLGILLPVHVWAAINRLSLLWDGCNGWCDIFRISIPQYPASHVGQLRWVTKFGLCSYPKFFSWCSLSSKFLTLSFLCIRFTYDNVLVNREDNNKKAMNANNDNVPSWTSVSWITSISLTSHGAIQLQQRWW